VDDRDAEGVVIPSPPLALGDMGNTGTDRLGVRVDVGNGARKMGTESTSAIAAAAEGIGAR